MRHKWIQIVAMVWSATALDRASAVDRKPLGEIEFFDYKGFTVADIRSALPFREGDLLPATKESFADLKRQVGEKVKRVIGREPTDVSFVCCDSKQNWMAYIGVPGESYRALTFNPVPTGNIRLPDDALSLHQEMDKELMQAVMNGHAVEDDSQGFALTNDPKARSTEIAIRNYAIHNEALIFEVLSSSSDAGQRAIAAQMVGYGRQSDEQIHVLVRASLDSDESVRNDALRALAVLAGAKPNLAQGIPPESFIHLLRSGAWTDHNKASALLVALTRNRDPRVLELLRTEALDSLLEMARWRSVAHAWAALSILGRIAGIKDDTVNQLIVAGQADAIISKFASQ